MPNSSIDNALGSLTESALDFLQRGAGEIEENPKYSVIHFVAGLELILKARLMHEHWSLAVDRISDASASASGLLAGECRTVHPGEAISRLNRICGENIPEDVAEQFKKVVVHRNRMTHFFHDAGHSGAEQELVESVVAEQCVCWYHSDRLLSQWHTQFHGFKERIEDIRSAMEGNKSYLQVKFEQVQPSIEAERSEGAVFRACRGCGHGSAKVRELSAIMFDWTCAVCRLEEIYLEFECPAECEEKLAMSESARTKFCPGCQLDISPKVIGSILNPEYSGPGTGDFHCAGCMSRNSVVLHHDVYVCTECLAMEYSVEECGLCHAERLRPDIAADDTRLHGCEFCGERPHRE